MFRKLILSALFFLAVNISAEIKNVPSQYSTIQAAVDAAVNGDTVLVAPGTYVENVVIRGKNIVLTGTYYITGDRSLIASTIIDGSSPINADTASCVLIRGGVDSTGVLQGFTLTKGKGTAWNDEHSAGVYREGGGLLVALSSPIIQDNIIKENIVNNLSGIVSTGGGGVRIGDGFVRFYNNVVMNNYARYGAGIVLNYTGGEFKNNIVCANYGSLQYGGGSGFWLNGGYNRPIVIENNSIADNSSNNSGTSGGIFGYGNVAATIRNNVIWRNTSPGMNQIIGNSLIVRYCNVQGGFSGAGNINSDPLFADSNYILQPGSPCVDKGDSSVIYNDLPDQGNPSIAKYPSRGGLRNDMGAYGGPLARILTNQLIGIQQISSNVPSGYVLSQNYPNPFNPATKIMFALKQTGFVTLKIYDITGRLVKVLAEEVLNTGEYESVFNAGELSSGIYFYTLRTDNFVQTKKMILTK